MWAYEEVTWKMQKLNVKLLLKGKMGQSKFQVN